MYNLDFIRYVQKNRTTIETQTYVTEPTLMVNLSATVSTRGHPKLKLRYRLPSGDSKRKSCNGSPYPMINVDFHPPNKG